MWYHEIFFTLVNLHFKLIASIETKNAALIICVISWITIADTGLTAKNLAPIEQSVMSHRIRGAIFVVHLTVNIVHSRTTDRQYAMVSSECYVSSDVIFNPTTDSSYGVTYLERYSKGMERQGQNRHAWLAWLQSLHIGIRVYIFAVDLMLPNSIKIWLRNLLFCKLPVGQEGLVKRFKEPF